jgi:hypothetical protein
MKAVEQCPPVLVDGEHELAATAVDEFGGGLVLARVTPGKGAVSSQRDREGMPGGSACFGELRSCCCD